MSIKWANTYPYVNKGGKYIPICQWSEKLEMSDVIMCILISQSYFTVEAYDQMKYLVSPYFGISLLI